MTSRRSFLKGALALVAAPFVVRAVESNAPDTLLERGESCGPGLLPPNRVYEVQGLAIKVPSNRIAYWTGSVYDADQRDRGWAYKYVGDWDGSFKLERGCSNPAWVLADLYERTGTCPDWVVNDRRRAGSAASPHLDWRMLYDYGRWCDEPVLGGAVTITNGSPVQHDISIGRPRLAVHAATRTCEDMDKLRETLRMHCLSWQSTDPRYRTSWPGVPYPGVDA